MHIFFFLRFPFQEYRIPCSGIQGRQTETWGHFGPFPGRYRDRGSHTPWFPSNTTSTFPYHPPCLWDFPVCTSFCPPPAQFRQPHPPNAWDPCVLTTALSCKVWKVSEGNCRGDWLSSPLLVLCWHPLKREMIGSENPNAYSYRFFLRFCCSLGESWPTLCNPVEGSPPGSSVHGISQANIPRWVAMASSRGIFQTQASNLHLLQWKAGSLPLSHL